MNNISKLRDTADYLLSKNKYEEAYVIYNEVNHQIWSAIGSVQQGLNDFSRSYLTYNVLTGIDFKNQYTSRAATSIFIKWFNLDSDQILNEFIFSLTGHLKCIVHSKILLESLSSLIVLNEYLTLYTLIMNNSDDRWVGQILRYSTPVFENNRLSKIRPNMQMPRLSKLLTEQSVNLINTDWNSLNFLMLEYLKNKGEGSSKLYWEIKNIAGEQAKESSQEYKRYEKYEKYEKYERYERYERYEHKSSSKRTRSSSNSSGFNPKQATEAQKAKFYGQVLGLVGVVSKKQIREKYLKLIAQYHPDKVHSLGEDLQKVAEEKSKMINEAYEWLKIKYGL